MNETPIRVLIADDHALVREGIRRVLDDDPGFDVVAEAADGLLLDYFHALLERLSWSAVKLDLYGLKFFYTHVLNKAWTDVRLIKPPRTKRIPDIISVGEVQKLIMATDKLSYRVFFFTLYSMGLRLGEGLRLQIGDINATHHRAHIRNAKGNKDWFLLLQNQHTPHPVDNRLVALPHNTLRILRRFWSLHRHSQFLFPSRKRGLKNAHLASMPMDRGGVQELIVSRWVRAIKHWCIWGDTCTGV